MEAAEETRSKRETSEIAAYERLFHDMTVRAN